MKRIKKIMLIVSVVFMALICVYLLMIKTGMIGKGMTLMEMPQLN